MEFFETSAKDNVNVKAVFERLVDIICDKMSESLDAEPSSGVANSSQTRQLTASVNNNQSSSCSCWRETRKFCFNYRFISRWSTMASSSLLSSSSSLSWLLECKHFYQTCCFDPCSHFCLASLVLIMCRCIIITYVAYCYACLAISVSKNTFWLRCFDAVGWAFKCHWNCKSHSSILPEFSSLRP